jgi:hypothetical protein
MATEITSQTESASVKQFNCSGCGASLRVTHPRAKEIACQYCGSVLDVQSEEHQILLSMGSPERHEPFSFIQLGMMAEFREKAYQVIARTRWRQRYKEYWREEGESGYSNEVWVYDEWLLIDADRTYFYLIEDQEGYWISNEIVPDTPQLLPRSLQMSFFQDQRDQRVQEYGGAEVIYFEGESNYHITKGDLIHFTMYQHAGINYSAEWRMASKDEIKEIEFFEERPISRRRLLESFSENEELAKLKEREAFWGFVYKVSSIATVIFFVLSFFACSDLTQTVERSQQLPLKSLLDQGGVLSDPIEVAEKGLYRLTLRASAMAENSEIYVFAYVLDSTEAAINTIDEELFYYAGYDDEGRWTETNYDVSQRFRLESGGTYYLRLFGNADNPAMITGTLHIELKDGVLLTRYFFLAAIFSLIVMVIASRKRGRS